MISNVPTQCRAKRMRSMNYALAVALFAVACTKVEAPAAPGAPAPQAEPEPAPAETEPEAAAPVENGSLSVSKPAPERVVAIGDLHGDLQATRRALRLAGAIDANDDWIGGKLVVVQTGDSVDRGDDDRAIIDLVERLKTAAAKAGGEFVALVGNHEIMNSMLDFRYVTAGGFSAFSDITPADDNAAEAAAALDAEQRGRAAAFFPGGPYAKILSKRPAVARVGDSIFVHGGVLPKYAKGLDATNDGVRTWLLGETKTISKALTADDGPLWTRTFSTDPGKAECALLSETLSQLNAKRMVMGHTIQKPDISAACDEKAWRIDVGMSAIYSGPVQVLELRGDSVKMLEEGSR